MNTKFPYKCIIKESGDEYIPTIIDYDNRQCWIQFGQSSDNGEWIDFSEVIFQKNRSFIDLTEISNY